MAKKRLAKNAIGQTGSEAAQIRRGGGSTLPMNYSQGPNRQKSSPYHIEALRRIMNNNRRKKMTQ